MINGVFPSCLPKGCFLLIIRGKHDPSPTKLEKPAFLIVNSSSVRPRRGQRKGETRPPNKFLCLYYCEQQLQRTHFEGFLFDFAPDFLQEFNAAVKVRSKGPWLAFYSWDIPTPVLPSDSRPSRQRGRLTKGRIPQLRSELVHNLFHCSSTLLHVGDM